MRRASPRPWRRSYTTQLVLLGADPALAWVLARIHRTRQAHTPKRLDAVKSLRLKEKPPTPPTERASRGLRGATRAPLGHVAACDGLKASALRARTTRQAPAGIEPAASWQALRGKCFALHIAGVDRSRAVRSQARSAARPLRFATRPSGSINPRYVLRPFAPAARPAGYSSPRSNTKVRAVTASPSP